MPEHTTAMTEEARAPDICPGSCECHHTHWRYEGAEARERLYYRIGAGSCGHSPHHLGVAYWGVCPSPRENRWYWSVVWKSEPSISGWADSETEAVDAVTAMRGPGAPPFQRCDRVASDELRGHEQGEFAVEHRLWGLRAAWRLHPGDRAEIENRAAEIMALHLLRNTQLTTGDARSRLQEIVTRFEQVVPTIRSSDPR